MNIELLKIIEQKAQGRIENLTCIRKNIEEIERVLSLAIPNIFFSYIIKIESGITPNNMPIDNHYALYWSGKEKRLGYAHYVTHSGEFIHEKDHNEATRSDSALAMTWKPCIETSYTVRLGIEKYFDPFLQSIFDCVDLDHNSTVTKIIVKYHKQHSS